MGQYPVFKRGHEEVRAKDSAREPGGRRWLSNRNILQWYLSKVSPLFTEVCLEGKLRISSCVTHYGKTCFSCDPKWYWSFKTCTNGTLLEYFPVILKYMNGFYFAEQIGVMLSGLKKRLDAKSVGEYWLFKIETTTTKELLLPKKYWVRSSLLIYFLCDFLRKSCCDRNAYVLHLS